MSSSLEWPSHVPFRQFRQSIREMFFATAHGTGIRDRMSIRHQARHELLAHNFSGLPLVAKFTSSVRIARLDPIRDIEYLLKFNMEINWIRHTASLSVVHETGATNFVYKSNKRAHPPAGDINYHLNMDDLVDNEFWPIAVRR